MDDQKLGQHCSDPTCRQKDYLPIKCKYCSHVYCTEHFSIDSHHCPEYSKNMKQVFSCPLCNKVIPVNANLSLEECFGIHEATECTGVYVEKKEERCATKKCPTKLYEHNTYKCKRCNKKLCLKHRMEESH